MSRFFRIGLVVIVVLAPAYWLLLRHSPSPGASYVLDIARVRALADSVPGAKALEVRYEKICDLKFYEGMLMAGDPWTPTSMPIYSFQLVFPDSTLLIDTAMARAIAKPDALLLSFDDAAWQRLLVAMEHAEQIVITHEHMDHIGGIAAHPRLAQIRDRVRLTEEQLGNPEGMDPAQLPADAMAGYEPLRYDVMHAIAPGVVLIEAPGHTPGSQMVYVKRADGRELLFLGDVSWRERNIEQVRERPLLMTLVIGENREQVLGQFQALNALRASEPALAQVPGHDGPAMERFTAAGLLQPGFAAP
ncbi:MAG TPA: MBL fold metallo-hydrolase [Verrucomicrobiae bacterium]|nr:MBL fold metallo-hydrolase [Verrucomicrobiae bacterium]